MDQPRRAAADGRIGGVIADQVPEPSLPSGLREPSPTESSPPLQVTFDLESGEWTAGAREKYRHCVRSFGIDLSRAIHRLEEDDRAPGEDTIEVTRSMVIKANDEVRSLDPAALASHKPSLIQVWTPIAATATGGSAGVLGSYLNSWWQWMLCISLGVATIGILIGGAYELRRRS